jgi:hypothetical protein
MRLLSPVPDSEPIGGMIPLVVTHVVVAILHHYEKMVSLEEQSLDPLNTDCQSPHP